MKTLQTILAIVGGVTIIAIILVVGEIIDDHAVLIGDRIDGWPRHKIGRVIGSTGLDVKDQFRLLFSLESKVLRDGDQHNYFCVQLKTPRKWPVNHGNDGSWRFGMLPEERFAKVKSELAAIGEIDRCFGRSVDLTSPEIGSAVMYAEFDWGILVEARVSFLDRATDRLLYAELRIINMIF